MSDWADDIAGDLYYSIGDPAVAGIVFFCLIAADHAAEPGAAYHPKNRSTVRDGCKLHCPPISSGFATATRSLEA